MPKVMIHACEDRIEYVNDFLVPLLIKSGVKTDNIEVYTDHGDGCLKSYIKAFSSLQNVWDFTWHLQDDVLPTLNFSKWAFALEELYDDWIICGFGNKEFYNSESPWYAKNGAEMFYSFPCIGIPNFVALNFVEWYDKIKNDPKYQQWIVHNKFVDYLFKLYIGDNTKHKYNIVNFRPCLVEHVDEFVGGSTINKQRGVPAKAIQFKDDEAMEILKEWYRRKKNGYQ